MSIFQSLIKKEVLHLLRDFRTVTVVLVMPVVLLLLFGFAISTEVNNVKVVAVVEQHTDETKQIIDRFRSNSYFTFEGIVPYREVESVLRKGRADAAVVFRTEDGRLKHQIIVDASNTTMAQTATAYLENVISSATGIPVVANTLYNPQLKSAYNFVPGIMGMIFILICSMMTSVSIVSEKESGTMNLLLVSPVRPRTIILGKLVPYFLLSCIILTLVLVLSYTALLPALVHHPDTGAGVELYCVGSAFLLQRHQRDMGNHPVCGSCPCIGTAYFHHCLYTGIGSSCFRCDVYDSRGVAVRHDISGGEHAVGSAMAFVHHSGTLVYFSHAGINDSATSRRICAD